MQFYVIHKDPKRNAELLPDYAIKSVNVREGWQILSDIGHATGTTWEGQNKCYNINHPATRRWYRDRHMFNNFINYYSRCLTEYRKRFGKETSFHVWFKNLEFLSEIFSKLPENRTEEEFTIQYLLTSKKNKLTSQERENLYDKSSHS